MSFDSISDTIDRALASAGLDPRSGVLKSVTETIRRALADAGLPQDPKQPSPMTAPAEEPAQPVAPGSFTEHRYRGEHGSRGYKLYVPVTAGKTPLPLVVMLHGCKQDPDDFAMGTRMNQLADEHGFLVAYPAQTRHANGSNCWNWFQPGDQKRDAGEPSILAGIVKQIAGQQAVDTERVFVAGLSAGAAMAVILGATYPDVFKAVGAHSGLAHGAARDVASAFGAMHAGHSGQPAGDESPGMPTIVFQGDQDTTVVAANADAIVRQALGGEVASLGVEVSKRSGRASADSHAFSATVYADESGRIRAEKWVVKGGTHAWFGGNEDGSYTDAKGPDASAEMVRFFLAR
jgi:poly(hydroxyalkanoate) depolymerase family esterase